MAPLLWFRRSVNNGEGQWLECVMTSLGKVGSIQFPAPLTITEGYWWAPHVALRDAHAEQALRSHMPVFAVSGALSFCHKGKGAGDHLQSTSQLFLHPTWNETYRVSMLQSVDRYHWKSQRLRVRVCRSFLSGFLFFCFSAFRTKLRVNKNYGYSIGTRITCMYF